MHYLLLFLLVVINNYAQAGIGVVSDAKGTSCQIERNKNKMAGTKGAQVESMDTYSTGACVSNITFKDDSKVKITENSRLVIDDFVFDPKKSDAGKIGMKVAMGTVRMASGQIAKNNPQLANIKTPTATISVRGTDFSMTVDETGQSLIMLLPSCKEESEMKKYELDEQRCKVGKIIVENSAGIVELDKAFEATYVISNSIVPSPPVVVNTIESKIGNNLILVQPTEVANAVKEQRKSQRDKDLEEMEAEAQRRISQRIEKANEENKNAELLPFTFDTGSKGCNPSLNVCVAWEKADAPDIQSKGRGIAFRSNEDHYAEVKTTGYGSNTYVAIIHNDQHADAIIGDGSPGGNVVIIRQSSGVLRRP
jgi:hypothetical protein